MAGQAAVLVALCLYLLREMHPGNNRSFPDAVIASAAYMQASGITCNILNRAMCAGAIDVDVQDSKSVGLSRRRLHRNMTLPSLHAHVVTVTPRTRIDVRASCEGSEAWWLASRPFGRTPSVISRRPTDQELKCSNSELTYASILAEMVNKQAFPSKSPRQWSSGCNVNSLCRLQRNLQVCLGILRCKVVFN